MIDLQFQFTIEEAERLDLIEKNKYPKDKGYYIEGWIETQSLLSIESFLEVIHPVKGDEDWADQVERLEFTDEKKITIIKTLLNLV